MKSIVLRLLCLGFCVYMVVMIAGLWSDYSKKKQERQSLLTEKEQLTNDIDELRSILAEDSHTELIERVARERLGYIYPGEKIYVDTTNN